VWLNGRVAQRQFYYQNVLTSGVHSPDPFQTISSDWLVRRLWPDCNPIKIEELPGKRDEEILLRAMGTETANVLLGDRRQTKAILADLKRRDPAWLPTAAKKMAKFFLREWKEYRG
jgi:hypothetical protein